MISETNDKSAPAIQKQMIEDALRIVADGPVISSATNLILIGIDADGVCDSSDIAICQTLGAAL